MLTVQVGDDHVCRITIMPGYSLQEIRDLFRDHTGEGKHSILSSVDEYDSRPLTKAKMSV